MKKVLIGMMAVITGFTFVGKANAAEFAQLKSDDNNIDVVGEKTDAKLTLNGEANQVIEVKAGEKFTIDLKGNVLEAFCKECSAIIIDEGAEVIIEDSENGGVVKRKSDSNNNASTISNSGKLTINGGTIEATGTEGSAGIWNQAKGQLVFNGGSVKTTAKNVWGINNAGEADIYNGTFIQTENYSVILNENKMNIQNGIFQTEGDSPHNSLLTNGFSNHEATLSIVDGSFDNKDLIIWNGNDENAGGKVEITGGTYSDYDAIKNLLKEGYEIKDGEIVQKEEVTPTDPTDDSDEETIDTTKKPTSNEKLDDVPKTGNGLSVTLIGAFILMLGTGRFLLKNAK